MRDPKASNLRYRDWISRASAKRNTRIILALDVEGGSSVKVLDRSKRLLNQTISHLCAVKLGRQTVLNLDAKRTRQLITKVHDENIPCIIDDKLNDIGETNQAIAEAYFRIGFDGLTANPFAGWHAGLRPVFQLAHQHRKGVILLTYMSHQGASEGYGQKVVARGRRAPQPQYVLFAHNALSWGADGVVVGATRPEVIREVKSILQNNVPIYSPGIGAQGGKLKEASRAGTDYFIIGRSITRDPHPRKAAQRYAGQSVSFC